MAPCAWLASVGLPIGTLVSGWVAHPPKGVSPHADAVDNVDRYGSRIEFLGVMPAMSAVTVVLVPLIVRYAVKGDAPLLNIPHKDYRLAPERADRTKAGVTLRADCLFAATNLRATAAIVTTHTLDNGRAPFDPGPPAGIGLVLVACLSLFLHRYRRPAP